MHCRVPRTVRGVHELPLREDSMTKRIPALLALFLGASFAMQGVLAQPADGTLGRIKQAKAINVAYSPDSLPFSLREQNGAAAGYTIEICKRVIAQIGRAVGDPNLKVNWIPGSVTERLQMVASGKADLECANTTPTQSRLASVDFSNLVFVDTGGFLVASAPIKMASDLGGKRIAVLKGTTTEARLNEMLKKRLINANVVPIANAGEGIAMLEAGSADAYAGDKLKLVGLVATSAKDPSKFFLLSEDLSFEPYALALPRGDSALRLEVNKALTQIYMTPEIERIFNQWMGKLGQPSGILAAMYLLNSIPE
jgi:ABC-type amino acid transport substrate-binding protein